MTRSSGSHPAATEPRRALGRGKTTWVALRAAIMARISDGTYPPGELIPPETELAAEFGCARATVNRALGSLAARGVLDRRRRIGTRVALGLANHETLHPVPLTRDLIESSGQRFSFDNLGATGRPPIKVAAERLFRSDHADIVETHVLLRGDDRVLCLEQRWHDAAALPGLTEAIAAGVLANDWMVLNVPLSMAEHDVSAETARAVEADALLGCPPSAPVLVYGTCFWAGAIPVSFSRHIMLPGETVAVPALLPPQRL